MAKRDPILRWPGGVLDFSDGCLIMGVLNVTPDSFSDGGQFLDVDAAVAHGIQMADQGAAIIDVGGESSRPGSGAVDTQEQTRRVVPVIEQLAERLDVPISIDTFAPEVAAAALDAGASMVNDITALADEEMARLVGERQVPVVLMHMQGTPATMQAEPTYADVVTEVRDFLIERAAIAKAFGIPAERIFIDPGIGFGKTLEHNLLLVKRIDQLVDAGHRVLVGTSRKSFIGKIIGKEVPSERLLGTAATVALCAAAGVSVVRVHDVAQMADVIRVVEAVQRASVR